MPKSTLFFSFSNFQHFYYTKTRRGKIMPARTRMQTHTQAHTSTQSHASGATGPQPHLLPPDSWLLNKDAGNIIKSFTFDTQPTLKLINVPSVRWSCINQVRREREASHHSARSGDDSHHLPQFFWPCCSSYAATSVFGLRWCQMRSGSRRRTGPANTPLFFFHFS